MWSDDGSDSGRRTVKGKLEIMCEENTCSDHCLRSGLAEFPTQRKIWVYSSIYKGISAYFLVSGRVSDVQWRRRVSEGIFVTPHTRKETRGNKCRNGLPPFVQPQWMNETYYKVLLAVSDIEIIRVSRKQILSRILQFLLNLNNNIRGLCPFLMRSFQIM